MSNPGRGFIGVPCREQGRVSTFWDCLLRLTLPDGCSREPIVRYNNSVAQARNQIAEEALKRGADWIFWLDDDMLFGRDVLMRLVQRPEAIVIGLTMMRCTGDGVFRPIWSTQPMTPEPNSQRFLWHAAEEVVTGANGMMRLRSGTGGGVLTRRVVFDTLPAPWWQQGQYDPEMFFEDIYFYDKATEAGIEIWGDPSVRFGHYQPTVLWPHQRPDGSWSTVLAHGFDGFLEQPWPTPQPQGQDASHGAIHQSDLQRHQNGDEIRHGERREDQRPLADCASMR